jgi:hypothetical protein
MFQNAYILLEHISENLPHLMFDFFPALDAQAFAPKSAALCVDLAITREDMKFSSAWK